MLKIALIDSGVAGGSSYFGATAGIFYRHERITADWHPDFSGDDMIVVPNGANHVALYEARAAIRGLLDRGGTLACFCGFFTPWIPGHVWHHSNRHPLKDVRYAAGADPLDLLSCVDIDGLSTEAHGISGWWACGEIRSEQPGSTLLHDSFGRVVMIADTHTTPGLIVATASGPLGDPQPDAVASATVQLYRNLIGLARRRLEKSQ